MTARVSSGPTYARRPNSHQLGMPRTFSAPETAPTQPHPQSSQVLYALAMLPLGIAADRVQSRPRLLAWGIAAWSLLTLGAARTHSFAELLAARVGFAGAQATQNPVCFALIPDLFPKNRTRAMALYNAAIYAGRALSFGVLMLAVKLGVPKVRGGRRRAGRR